MKIGAGTARLEVMNPSSGVSISAKNAPRLDSIEGKTICEVWHSSQESGSTGWRGGETFPVIRELLQKRFPGAKIVPYSDFPPALRDTPFPYWVTIDKVGEVLRGKGCDAIVLGNGG